MWPSFTQAFLHATHDVVSLPTLRPSINLRPFVVLARYCRAACEGVTLRGPSMPTTKKGSGEEFILDQTVESSPFFCCKKGTSKKSKKIETIRSVFELFGWSWSKLRVGWLKLLLTQNFRIPPLCPPGQCLVACSMVYCVGHTNHQRVPLDRRQDLLLQWCDVRYLVRGVG